MTLAQSRELGAALVRNMPDLTGEQAQAWIDDPEALKAFLARMNFPLQGALSEAVPFTAPVAKPASKKPARVPLPADGLVFQLMVVAFTAHPMTMVRGDGYDPEGWKFNGTPLSQSQTNIGQFKLVRLGPVSSLVHARVKAHAMGVTLAEGQWREAFKAAYPRNDKSGSIAFGGETSEWVDSKGYRRFPVLLEHAKSGRSDFYWADYDCGGSWRWLVREQPSK